MHRQERFTDFKPRPTVISGRAHRPAGHRLEPVRVVDGFSKPKPSVNFKKTSYPKQLAKQVTMQDVKSASKQQNRRQVQQKPAPHKVAAGSSQNLYVSQMFPVANPRRWQVATAAAEEPKRRTKLPSVSAWLKQQTRPQLAMLLAAGFIFVFGLTASLMGFRANSNVEAQTKKLSQSAINEEDAGDRPDETEPSDSEVANYRVDPSYPKRISIPKIGVNARIKPLDTKKNNELKAPANIYDAGWYHRSAKPGEQGATLIDGHLHGLTKPGIFYNLKKLSTGDVVEVERGDGAVFRYKVVRTQKYSRHDTDMTAAVTPVDSSRPGLNIISCTGALEKNDNTYSERLLVQTVLID